MPLEWKRGRNPYSHNYFGILSVGPNTPIAQIVALARQLTMRIESGASLEVAGEKIDTHQISKACSSLQDDKTRAQELLLAHSEVRHQKKQLNELLKKLRETAQLPTVHEPLSLVHPLAIFWFVPAPGPEAAPCPELADFNLVGPNDKADHELDIVFDS